MEETLCKIEENSLGALRGTLRTWAEVDLDAIEGNFEAVRKQLPHGKKLLVILKADAYGHGALRIAKLLEGKADYYAVAFIDEAVALRKAGITTPIMLLGHVQRSDYPIAIENDVTLAISTAKDAEVLSDIAATAGKVGKIHLAVDTGMGREGFLPSELGEVAPQIAALPNLSVEGVMSHFPAADEDVPFTQDEIGVFNGCVQELSQHFDLRYRHIAASAGELGYEIPVANLARPGLLLYGVAPMASIYDGVLRPTLRLSSRVSLVRELPAGHGVAYGRTFITDRPTRVATIGIGYADGWSRRLSGSGARVCIRGQFCPMLGRVTMDQIMADVTNVPDAVPGDIVELIGPHIPVTEVAERAGTIVWEIFTGLGPRLPRNY